MLGRDKYDRPVVYCRTRDLRMGDSQPDHQCVLLMFIMDYCMSIMPPHADQMVFVFDVQDFGYAQFYIEPLKKVLHVMQSVFVHNTARFVVINPNFTTRFLYAAVKPFLNERSRNKAEFLSDITI